MTEREPIENDEPKVENVIHLDIDRIINTLIKNNYQKNHELLTFSYCQALSIVAREQLKNDQMVLLLDAPIRVIGDIHGQFDDLMRIFNMAGYPPIRKYLFLGDYIDRGGRGLECICLLFAFKIKYPTKVYLLRGNHECEVISRIYGFRDEITHKFQSRRLWWTFLRTFNYLPIASIIESSIFCCHGGISPEFMNKGFRSLISDINKVARPYEIPVKGMICDLLWADPLDQVGKRTPSGFVISDRGCSWSFGYDMIDKFLEKFDLDLIVRAHQVVEDGYEFYANRKLLTVFSAPNYCGEFDNAGGILVLENVKRDGMAEMVEGKFLILKPTTKSQNKLLKSCGIGRKLTKLK